MAFFKNMKGGTRYAAKHSVYLYGDECLADAIDGAIEVCRELDVPRYIGFADYDGLHDGQSITAATALVLEWSAIMAPRVITALEEVMWAHLLVDTEGKGANRIAAIIPLAEPITNSKTYTHVASLLATFLGIYHLSDGCWANSFLIKFQPFAKSVFVNGTVFDAESFLAKHKGTWTDVAKFVGSEPIKEIERPTFARIRRGAAKVQLHPPKDLFEGL